MASKENEMSEDTPSLCLISALEIAAVIKSRDAEAISRLHEKITRRKATTEEIEECQNISEEELNDPTQFRVAQLVAHWINFS